MPLTLPQGRRFVPAGSAATVIRAYDDATPPTDAATDDTAYAMGLTFSVTAAAQCTEIRWWQPTTNSPSSATRSVTLWRLDDASTGTDLTGLISGSATVTGWNTVTLPSPVTLTVSQQYRAAVLHPAGRYPATANWFSSGPGSTGYTEDILVVPNNVSTVGTDQGSFTASSTMVFPASSFQATNYWIDVSVVAT